ncbi:hypothetical protein ARAM_005160 [Aspergillus rambellii]|uniref:non-specific serine/threonine protein kinase n=1 Tax=Aspergillus rambellii TaxID=308745 RepID=A0A0F8WI63_9EURO|nr:hypothetical protein ARAM_005160 [Aspergillus rambellii]
MDGDLSLSQSLGGLRIANPDDASLHSSEDATTPAASAAPTPSVVPDSKYEHTVSDLPPSSSVSPFTPADDRDSVYPSYRPDVQPQPTSHYTSPFTSQPQHPAPSTSSRPVSALFANGAASAAAVREGSYRIRTDSAASSASESIARTERGGSAALQAGVPIRDNSHSDRSYKTAQIPPANGVAVMRQPSRARAAAPPQLSGAPYGMENGPMTSSEEWQDRGAAVAVRQEIDANGKPVARYIKKGVRDFSFGHTLGEGSYSTVVLGTDRQTLKEYAIKILDKRHIIKEKKVKYVNIEKDTLNRLTDHPGIVRLYYTFQDERSLYFVLDLCKGGELLGVLKRMTTFDEECTRFYGAQILDTIDYMHKCGVIHRDLKPENVLLDSQMYVKITDFGTAKILKSQPSNSNQGGIPSLDADMPEEERASSFVGTAEYVSPELLTDKNACKASDLWAFGCIIYQLIAGRPPFKAGNEYQTFQKIVALDYEFPVGFPSIARDLVERLLVLDPARRLPIEHIKNHESSMDGESFPPSISTAPSNNASSRVVPRLVTEVPAPSQLDIEWSPVLTKTNERILKMGNLVVVSSPPPHSPVSKNGSEYEAPKKFSRFFGGSTTKKRQRLVMVTSSGRIIMAAAGGEEKKAKLDISLLAPGTHYRSSTDAKGSSCWIVDTRDKHFVFEDPKPSSNNLGATALSAQEWLDTLDRAREMALALQSSGPYSADEAFRDISSGLSSHANTLDQSSDTVHDGSSGRATLVKHHANDSDSIKGKKRFSRRHSKNGLAAVF